MSLYNFEKSHAYLDTIGVPRLNVYEDNVVIERKEFKEQEANGEIEWREDGVYLKVDGEYRRGFLYNKDFLVDRYGMPKFHVAKCRTLQSFEANGTLHTRYYWANASKVLVTQRGSSEEYPDTVLNICNNCVDLVVSNSISRSSTTDSEFISPDMEIEPTTDTDIRGRPMNWPAISRRYREKMSYTCEKCGFGGADLKKTRDRRYIDADHIVAQELMNTADSNLQCLCALCHSFKDSIHEAHLAKPHVRLRVAGFISEYANVLAKKNATLLNRFKVNYSD
jgi:hypothetical protein